MRRAGEFVMGHTMIVSSSHNPFTDSKQYITSLTQLDVNDWRDTLGQGGFGAAYKVRHRVTRDYLCAKKIRLDSTTMLDHCRYFLCFILFSF